MSGTTTLTSTFAGISRTIIVHVPVSYRDKSAAALLLNMHGSGSSAAAQEAFTEMNATSDAGGFIVAYPQGEIRAGSGYDWNVPGQPLFGGASPPKDAPDDVAFLADAITLLQSQYCIDAHRVYATGFSGGARMASQLACDLSGRIAAIAPVDGLRLPSPCPATRAVSVLSFHGTADPIDPYNGNGQKYWTYGVSVAAQRWGTQDGCATDPTETAVGGNAEVRSYTDCAQGAEVDLYTLTGAGHTWPGGPTLPVALVKELGPQAKGVDADTLIWSFFKQHPLR